MLDKIKKIWKGRSIWRKILIIACLVQAVGFFLIPYAHAEIPTEEIAALYSEYSGLRFTGTLTGLTLTVLYWGFSLSDACVFLAMEALVIITAVIHIRSRKKGSHWYSIALQLVELVIIFVAADTAAEMEGYSLSVGVYAELLLCAFIIAVSILGVILDKRIQEDADGVRVLNKRLR